MLRARSLLSALLLLLAAPLAAQPAGDAERAAILAPIHALFAAFEAGDSAAMLRVVYPDGRVTAPGRGEGSGLRQMSWTQFAQRVTPEGAFQERISDPTIAVDGDIAMVWAPFVVLVGGRVVNCGYDHFDLVRENGVWRVMNLIFSSRPAGCPAQ